MKTITSIFYRIKALCLLRVSTRVYWVFRNYVQIVDYKKCDKEKEFTYVLDVSFHLHFVEPFTSKKEAKKAVKFAQELQPWQKFFILHGC